jgi:hypothetical protein
VAAKYSIQDEFAIAKKSGKAPPKRAVWARKNVYNADAIAKIKLAHDDLLIEVRHTPLLKNATFARTCTLVVPCRNGFVCCCYAAV